MDIFDLLLPKYTINKKIRLISLFSGYDSQKLAFDYLNINVEHYKAIEFDKYAIQSLNEIHNTNFKQTDIKNVKGEDLQIIDKDKYTYLLTYSFPCQDLSLSGKGKGMTKDSGTRSGMLWEVERLLKETKQLPDILIMENVRQVITADGWREWNAFLESLGYNNYAEVLNAKDYGIPQNRQRCFMVSILGDYSYEFPKKIQLKIKRQDLEEKTIDEKYSLSDKMKIYISKTGTEKFNNCDCKINLTIARPLTTDTNKRAGTSNYKCKDLPESFDLRNISVEDIIKLKIDKLTPREYFRLMGVKDIDYNKLTCSESQKYKQAGNSIVTTVLMAIYSQLFENCDYEYYINKLIDELKVSD